jgi:hypothetical protein
VLSLLQLQSCIYLNIQFLRTVESIIGEVASVTNCHHLLIFVCDAAAEVIVSIKYDIFCFATWPPYAKQSHTASY